MYKMNKNIIILISCIVVSIVLNIGFYSSLPSQVGLQASISGGMNNYVSKQLFVWIVPIVLTLNLLYVMIYKKNENNVKTSAVGIILTVANAFIVLMNLA